jgi:hypothetical protein
VGNVRSGRGLRCAALLMRARLLASVGRAQVVLGSGYGGRDRGRLGAPMEEAARTAAAPDARTSLWTATKEAAARAQEGAACVRV